MKHTIAVVGSALLIVALAGLTSCGPSMQNAVSMGCGETQSVNIGTHKCVVITRAEGDCAVKATAQCEGESEKSTVVKPDGNEGRLCCDKAIGKVEFSTVGDSSGKCEFTYGRDD